jgi:hypothetical protein
LALIKELSRVCRRDIASHNLQANARTVYLQRICNDDRLAAQEQVAEFQSTVVGEP